MGKRCLQLFSAIFNRIFFIIAGNEDNHKVLNEFEFQQNRTASPLHPQKKNTLWLLSRLHPCYGIPSVFEAVLCNSLFALNNFFCWNETKNVYGMYRIIYKLFGWAGSEQLANVIGFRLAYAIFPRKMYFYLAHGDAI